MRTIRPYTAADHPALIRLWKNAFGDPESFICAFLELLPAMGTCLVAEEDGEVCASAYLLEGARASLPGQAEIPLVYLYAVSTDDRLRGQGIGSLLMNAVRSYADQTRQYLYTSPAEEWLFGWYQKTLSVSSRFRLRRNHAAASGNVSCVELTPEEYLERRKQLLRDRPHLVPPVSWAAYLSLICRTCGGALLETEDGICAAYPVDGDSAYLADCISDMPERLAASAAHHVHRGVGIYRFPSPDGTDYIISDTVEFPPHFLWNFTFE